MTTPITPAALSGASIVIQICVLTIAYVALGILGRSLNGRLTTRGSHSTLVLWLLLTIIVIVMGEDLYAQWSPVLGNVALPSIPREGAFVAVFVLDIIFVTVLIFRTGGAKMSPFTSILFLLPTLAIFLREPAWRFLLYSFFVGIIYVSMLKVGSFTSSFVPSSDLFSTRKRDDEVTHDWATRWANMACLALATLIGYITQPK
ncbi:hypothetical protein METUNv1_01252 [Methyloversatilis universalis FAM5]|uniref:Uncharacterized protein n=1 Tax=Methyloversatilis universalis (strain ATCC BAA-1314 / DSM 25237 / JCM 13912 / CCUG 52030 / FAM5) TaxID=1000565 RepID=F5RAN8_METUF|nr:hypothetical protein [Methyloversatilis universalis]EGK72487.1 hypothetical protein METUNv1_01252 [Methyloversatilis universalis FAM5]PZU55463.1 MAG: hypothetical protein DI561_02000 [Thauera sp.]